MQVFAALIEIGVSGEDRYNEASSVGALLDGDMQLATDLTFNRIRVRSSPSRLTFNRSGSGSVETYLEAGGSFAGGTFYIQNLDGVTSQLIADIDATRIFGGSFNIDDTSNAEMYDAIALLGAGGRAIVAFTLPSVTVRSGSGESGSAVSAGIEGTGRKLDAPTRSGSGEAGSAAAEGIEGTGRSIAIPAIVRTGDGEAGSVSASGLEGTGQAVTPLLLSASDDTGLAVETKALLVASAPGTVGNDPYVDSNRGGSDTPLDGGLGVGPGNTAISRFRRLAAGELTLNDNDDPVALNFGDYFDAGGDGNDLTIYLRTLNDGEVSFTVAAQYVIGAGNYFRVTLPADAQTLFDNLATGDRWIFKTARPATAVTQTGSGEAGSVAAAGIEGTGRKLDAPTRTGSGEAGSAAAEGIEGTGRSIAAVTRTGSGELGSVVAEGIEGTGEAIVPSTDITQEFDLGSVAAFDDWFGSILIDPRLVAEGAAAYLRSVERIRK